MTTKIGHVTRESGYLFYVDGDGNVIKTPMKGHKGKKAKVATFTRPAKCLCWIASNGDVVCKKR